VSAFSDLAVVHGWPQTKTILTAWSDRPLPVVGRWVALSGLIAAAMLLAVWLVSLVSTPDPTPRVLPGINGPSDLAAVRHVVLGNLLVLALHAMACLAGFIAKSSLPREAAAYRGAWRRVHDHAGPLAIAFVAACTVFSRDSQTLVLGHVLASLAAQFATSPGALLAGLLGHALPELTALFLPLAAWLIAARARAWDHLMAATLVTTALALPVVLLSALVEVYVTPRLLTLLHFV
jgi:hypothetical protein